LNGFHQFEDAGIRRICLEFVNEASYFGIEAMKDPEHP